MAQPQKSTQLEQLHNVNAGPAETKIGKIVDELKSAVYEDDNEENCCNIQSIGKVECREDSLESEKPAKVQSLTKRRKLIRRKIKPKGATQKSKRKDTIKLCPAQQSKRTAPKVAAADLSFSLPLPSRDDYNVLQVGVEEPSDSLSLYFDDEAYLD